MLDEEKKSFSYTLLNTILFFAKKKKLLPIKYKILFFVYIRNLGLNEMWEKVEEDILNS